MRASVVVCFSLLLAMAQVAVAERPTFDSPEAMKNLFDSAVPDLQKMDMLKVEAFFRKVYPETNTGLNAEAATRTFRASVATVVGPGAGTVVDWKYLGMKQIGVTCRRYVYLCRYAKCPVVWQFTVFKKGSRWLFGGYLFTGMSDSTFNSLSEDPPEKDEAAIRLCDELVDLAANGKAEFGDKLRQMFVSHDPSRDAALEQLVRQIRATAVLGGRPLTSELVLCRELGGVFAEYGYLILYEEGCVFYTFQLYRPSTEWRVGGLKADADGNPIAARLPLKSSGPAQTACTSKESESREAKPKLW